LPGDDYAREVGACLRRIRLRRGMSLQDVQAASAGRWKAAIVGAYERGDRNVTVARLSELAEFYGVSVGQALPGEPVAAPPSPRTRRRIVLNLARLDRVPDAERDALERFAAAIYSERGSVAEPSLAIREGDLLAIAAMCGNDHGEMAQRLETWGLI
jgi:transcriptional regulator with XRE-family HTH domain